MFQFPGFASLTYVFSQGYCLRSGSPHSDIDGSKDALASPSLFAECHVFLRLLVPRHSPNALVFLSSLHITYHHLNLFYSPAGRLLRCSLPHVQKYAAELRVGAPFIRPLKQIASLKLDTNALPAGEPPHRRAPC